MRSARAGRLRGAGTHRRPLPDGDGALVRSSHRGLPGAAREAQQAGWVLYLGRLGVLAAGGDPGPDPMTG